MKESSERDRAIYDIIYQTCPTCLGSLIHTEDGPVEVPHEHVERIEGKARKMSLTREDFVKGEALPVGEFNDKAIPRGVEVKVLARDLHACEICGCKLHLHLHHVIFRSQGGPNEVWNLIALCEKHHACIHEGTLEIFMDPLGKITWNSKADTIDRILADELREYVSVPPVTIVAGARPTSSLEALREATSNGSSWRGELEGTTEALMKLAYQKEEARARVLKAFSLLSNLGRAPTRDELMNTALRGRAMVEGVDFRGCGKSGARDGKMTGTPGQTLPEAPETPPSGGSS